MGYLSATALVMSTATEVAPFVCPVFILKSLLELGFTTSSRVCFSLSIREPSLSKNVFELNILITDECGFIHHFAFYYCLVQQVAMM